MSAPALSSAMMKAYKEGLGVDFALTCLGVTKHVHSQVIFCIYFLKYSGLYKCCSQVLMARSPYFEAKVNRWCDKKRELVIDDCDLNTFNIIVDYMYGGAIPPHLAPIVEGADIPLIPINEQNMTASGKFERLSNLLRMADKLQMIDLKKEAEEFLIKTLNFCNFPVSHFVTLAEDFDCERLLMHCARRTMLTPSLLEIDFCANLIKEMPKFTASLLVALRERVAVP